LICNKCGYSSEFFLSLSFVCHHRGTLFSVHIDDVAVRWHTTTIGAALFIFYDFYLILCLLLQLCCGKNVLFWRRWWIAGLCCICSTSQHL